MADSVDVPTETFVEDGALKLVMPSEHPCLCQDSGVRRARSPELRGKNMLLTRLDQVQVNFDSQKNRGTGPVRGPIEILLHFYVGNPVPVRPLPSNFRNSKRSRDKSRAKLADSTLT